jgi:hypothetical protein
MKRFLFLLSSVRCLPAIALATAGLLSSAPAAELPELTPGLRYLRIHSLAQSAHELSDALLKPGALVLDLRYVADEPAADALRVLNSEPAKPALYVLVSPATPAAVAGIITATPTPLVTLGIKDSRPAPKVIVAQSVNDDRRAYAALDQGTTLEALVSGKMEKEHFDEAELVKEFKSGNHDAHPAEGDPDSATPAPAHLTDRVLQRTLQLYRAQQALKRS